MTPEQLAEIEARAAVLRYVPITEPCPVCGNPKATCKHKMKDAIAGGFRHIWDCPDCGPSAPFVGYDCPMCQLNDQSVDIPALCAEVRRLQLERDMWKQRTKVTAMLLIEAQERLNGTVALSGPSRDKAANVAQWIKECFNGWLADVKAMRSLSPVRLIEIDTAFSQGDIK